MKIIKSLIVILPFFLAACGERVSVPPAYEGKILSDTGYKPDTIPPSIFRLDPCLFVCDKLVLVEKSDKGVTEKFRLFMPKDQLNVKFDLRMTASVRDGNTDVILSRMTPQTSDNGNLYISFDAIYNVYGQPMIREIVRSVMSEYSIQQIASSREAVSQRLYERLQKELKNTPIAIRTIGLADVQFPDIIVKQKELAAERNIEIERQEAEKQIQLIKLQTELEKAKAQRAIRRENAQAAAEENEIAAKSVTPEYMEYKKLEVLAELAKNGSSVFVPFGALDEVGISNKMFTGK